MGDNYFSSLKSDFSRKALWELTKWGVLGLIAALWTFVGTSRAAAYSTWLEPYRWLLATTASLLLILFLGGLYRRLSRNRPSFGRFDFDYVLVRREIEYVRDDEDDEGVVEYGRLYRLRALREGLDVYRDKYHWTGSGDTAPIAEIRGQEVYKTFRKNVWQYY